MSRHVLAAMLRALGVLGVLVALATLARIGRAQEDLPILTQPVTDRAHVLSDQAIAAIGGALAAHRHAGHAQIAVLTVATTAGEPIEDYSLRVATAWGGGDKKHDDGALFVLAVADRRMRIEVGYGLEDELPDGKARLLLDGVRPELRAGDHAGAIAKVVNALIAATGGSADAVKLPAGVRSPRSPAGDGPAPVEQRSSGPGMGRVGYVLAALVGALVLLFMARVARAYRQHRATCGDNDWLLDRDPSSWSYFRNTSGSWSSGGFWSRGSSSWSWGSGSSSSSSSWSGGGGSFGGGGASSSW